MPLSIGTRLGPYEIVAPLGAGGMGEVYKARDTRLDRTVAIKVLPQNVALDTDLRQRFEREAKTLATLNHPHICSVFDVGEADVPSAERLAPSAQKIQFLVMEYLEGETLARRLNRTAESKDPALPLSEALRYAIQIADALDKAHRQGIVHRDLKPGNIMLTTSGAKLLDFGLAKTRSPKGLRYDPTAVAQGFSPALEFLHLLSRAADLRWGTASAVPAQGFSPAGGASAVPTVSTPLTAQGTLLGTFQYMAPEQLEGKEADARTDIFAFGAVVYEMVTGKKAFEGKSQASLIAAILDHDPPRISSLRATAPLSLSHVVARCLSKDPEERWQTAADLMRELMWTSEPVVDGDWAKGQAARSYSATRTSVWVLGSSILAAALGAVLAWGVKPVPVQKVARFVIADESLFLSAGAPDVAIASDGTRIAYLKGRFGEARLVVRSIDELESTPLVENLGGPGPGPSPFFSADGQWVGFHSGGRRKLERVSTQGGPSIPICDVVAPLRGASWGTDGTIVFATGYVLGTSSGTGLFRVRATGGVPEPLTTPDPAKGETGHQWPEILPGGDVVLFTILRGTSLAEAQLAALSLETGEQKVLLQGASNARWIPTDHILYSAAGTLFAVPFNRANLEIAGDPVPVLEGVTIKPSGAVNLSVSDNGTVVYVPVGASVPSTELVWVTREGREEPLNLEPRAYGRPRISPDGRLVTVDVQRDDGSVDVWLADLERANLARLTVGGSNQAPIWSRDGSHVIFASVRPGTDGTDLYMMAADRSEDERGLLARQGNQFPYSWSPDGRSLIFSDTQATTGRDIWKLELGGAASPVLVTPFNERTPALSPDGRWMVYVSDEAGREEVYVQAYPGLGRRVQISTNGGREPVWSAEGRELFYRSLDGRQMMVVEVKAAQTFNAGPARLLFEGEYVSSPPVNGSPYYDVSRDGRRFLMTRPSAGSTTPALIYVVLNWFEELKRLVPGN